MPFVDSRELSRVSLHHLDGFVDSYVYGASMCLRGIVADHLKQVTIVMEIESCKIAVHCMRYV